MNETPEPDEIRRIGEGAALLSLAEIGLGSVLHAFSIPLTGHFLSLNQGFLLTRFSLVEKSNKNLPTSISSVSALLKSLSPAGKKLTPMLAIGAQGLLFNLGTLVFGMNPLGYGFGMTLLVLWAFAQPALIYFLIYGETLLKVGQYFYEKLSEIYPFTSESLVFALAFLVMAKILLGLFLVFLAYRLPHTAYVNYLEFLRKMGWRRLEFRDVESPAPKPSNMSFSERVKTVGRDLLHPMFLISLALTAAFFVFGESATKSQIAWSLLRPVTIAFVIFYILRFFPFEQVVMRYPQNRLVRATQYTIDLLRKK